MLHAHSLEHGLLYFVVGPTYTFRESMGWGVSMCGMSCRKQLYLSVLPREVISSARKSKYRTLMSVVSDCVGCVLGGEIGMYVCTFFVVFVLCTCTRRGEQIHQFDGKENTASKVRAITLSLYS